jgi:hypothetical protein
VGPWHFVAAARIVLCLAADPSDPDRRIVAGLKSNLSRLPASLAFRLPDGRLEWERGAVNLDAEALLRPGSVADRDDQTDATALIAELLADKQAWPLEAKQAIEAAQARGIAERSIQRAAHKHGISMKRRGFGKNGQWLWHLPAIPDIDATTSNNVSSMASMWNQATKATSTHIDDTHTCTDGEAA